MVFMRNKDTHNERNELGMKAMRMKIGIEMFWVDFITSSTRIELR